jgi:tetratricopeptide (TPR) repeat protein
MLERLRARGRRTGTAEDSTEATLAKALQQGLEGYQAWRGGQRDLALRLLLDAQRHAHGGQNINDMLRWLLGRLQAEMGHPREALPYFESIAVTLPPSNYERGQVYEQLGMAAQAREAYALFLTPRQQPDSLVQSQNQKSREALDRLGAGAP